MTEVAMSTDVTQMTLVDWLDDLTVRFLLNLPPAELSSVPRLCFQVEEAQWFYEDFIRPANPALPSLNLRQFCLTLFQHCPLLRDFNAAQHLAAYEEFLAYKVRVPVRGAILLDDSMEEALLVRGYKKGANWSFPRGKINKNEPDIDCAIREVYEETGYDIRAEGLIELNQVNGEVKSFDVTMREQHMKLFVFRGVPRDTHFETKTRKEIGDIAWYKIKDLPGYKKQKGNVGYGADRLPTNKFYMVAPFLAQLKRWINEQRQLKPSFPNSTDVALHDQDPIAYLPDQHAPPLAPAVNPVALSSFELKKLLSIGNSDDLPPSSEVELQMPDKSLLHTSNLLSLLQGPPKQASNGSTQQHIRSASNLPISSPSTRPAHLPRHAESFLQNSTQPPRHSRIETSSSQGTNIPQNLASTLSGQISQHHPLEARSQSMEFPANISSGQDHGNMFNRTLGPRQNTVPGLQSTEQIPLMQTRPSAISQSQNVSALNLFINGPGSQPNQGPGPAPSAYTAGNHTKTSGPAAPEASKLPIPQLNAHSMKLLDAFKGPNSAAPSSTNKSPVTSVKAASVTSQQTALLKLLKQQVVPVPASATQSQSPADLSASAALLPTFSETSKKPKALSINEITRTLPLRSKASPSPSPAAIPISQIITSGVNSQQEPPTNPTPTPVSLQTPASAAPTLSPLQPASAVPKAFDERKPPTHSRSLQPSLPISSKPANAVSQASPHPSRRHLPRQNGHSSPKSRQALQKTESTAPAPIPQFSILQRPGSSAGKATKPLTSQIPPVQEATASSLAPHVLKRPSFGSPTQKQEATQVASETSTPLPGTDKTDRLLALFGKAPAPARSSLRESPKLAPEIPAANKPENLLSLFGQAPARATVPKTPDIPTAPLLVPERRPLQSGNTLHQDTTSKGSPKQTSQEQLLRLFTNNRSSAGSPETPISPFTLGTPIAHRLPLVKTPSRLGSLSSVMSEQQPPVAATPTEARGFLLDYLNGVVKKEGSMSK